MSDERPAAFVRFRARRGSGRGCSVVTREFFGSGPNDRTRVTSYDPPRISMPEPDVGDDDFATPFVPLHHRANFERAMHDRSITVDSYPPSIVAVKPFLNLDGA